MHDNATRLPGEAVTAVIKYIGTFYAETITAAEVGFYAFYRDRGIQQLQSLCLACSPGGLHGDITTAQVCLPEPDDNNYQQQDSEWRCHLS